MKSFVIFGLFVAAVAHAAPESVSLTCTGTVLAPGGTGASGPVSIAASTPGTYLNSPWTINVGFQNGSLMAPGSACGAQINPKLNCDYFRTGDGMGPFSLIERCGGMEADPGVWRAAVETSIVIDGDHGYFYCSNRAGGQTYHVELSGCK